MSSRFAMSWVASTRRWKKMYRGKMYVVSCRQLGVPETKDASWKAANAWWEEQTKLPQDSGEAERVVRAQKISRLVEDFATLDPAARKEAVEALLGAGSFDRLQSQADTMMGALEASQPERTVAVQVDEWKGLLRAACQSKQLSEGRFDAYCRKISIFSRWMGEATAIDAIDEGKLEAFYGFLSEKVSQGEYAPTTAHEILMTAKQFISRLAEIKRIPMPGNIRSRRFRFNHSAPAEIETFTVAEVRDLLARAPERMRLCLLLMLNCGHYQNDIAELKQSEVDWERRIITRRRSKTRERGGQVTRYELWPETFDLLRKYRAAGELALTTSDGNPLVRYWLEGGKMRRYDAVQSAWQRMGKARLGMKHLRKTSATLLGGHPQYKFYANHFLADSAKNIADRHYVTPDDREFFEALGWLRSQILAEAAQPRAQPLLQQQGDDEIG